MIAITGIGCVTGFGAGVPALADGLAKGQTALLPNSWKSYAVARFPEAMKDRRDRCTAMIERAIDEAAESADIYPDAEPLPMFIGTTHGELGQWEAENLTSDPTHGPMMPRPGLGMKINVIPDPIILTTACTASAYALSLAIAHIKSGKSDICVVAGGDVISDFLLEGFVALRSYSKTGCRPFAADRDGVSMGEGAAALIVESYDSACARGATPLALVTGFGAASDARHMTAPNPSGRAMAKAITYALKDTTRRPDYVNVHGTGSSLNDRMEYSAIRRVFADDLSQMHISATKAATGHLCGGAAVLEIIISILALNDGPRPYLLGMTGIDSNFTLLNDCPQQSNANYELALATNCAFGGSNTAVLLQRPS